MNSDARALLTELRTAKNPNICLSEKYQSFTNAEKRTLNEAIRELERSGYLSVLWADNIAYYISLKKVDNVEADTNQSESILIIGNNNKITNSNIGTGNSISYEKDEKRFWEKHPFALALITAIIAAFIMMFSFWEKIVAFLEGLFS